MTRWGRRSRRWRFGSVLAGTTLLVSILCVCCPLSAKPPNGGPVVDIIQPKSSIAVRGILLRREEGQPLQVASSVRWLTEKGLINKYRRENEVLQKAAHREALDRVREIVEKGTVSQKELFFLRGELERLEGLVQQDSTPETAFLWCDFEEYALQRVTLAPRENRTLACLAWKEGLANVEMRDAFSIRKELEAKGISLDAPCPDLTDQLPSRPQLPCEWEARLGILEYTLAGAMDFQGMGDTVLLIQDNAPIAWDAILTKVIIPKFNDLLLNPFDDRPAKPSPPLRDRLKQAMQTAEEAKRRSFRATTVDINIEKDLVTVETRLMVQMAGRWETVWKDRETLNAQVDRPEEEKRIRSDPAVAKIVEETNRVGLAGSPIVDRAIRFGAATMKAQQTVDGRFFQFRDCHSRRVTGPPVRLVQE